MIGAAIRKLVRERAADRREYCRLPQAAYDLKFHVEHIVASQHRADDSPDNLALACDRCNLHKGTNLVTLDDQSEAQVSVFNPRTQSWQEHFGLVGAEVVGLTLTGRVSVRLLGMNGERRMLLRRQLIEEGVF